MVSGVDVLVLTHRPDEQLSACIESVISQAGSRLVRVIVAVNNDVTETADVIGQLRDLYAAEAVSFVDLFRNWGYAEGINRGLASCTSPMVMLLNDDAALAPGSLESLAETLDEADPTIVGVVPKTLLKALPRVIDNVGACANRRGEVHNRGVGEIDIGQYNRPDLVAGACFAAVLLRRNVFKHDAVGPLDSSFFMYAEDADWCLRARLHGYAFRSCPSAIVFHEHSKTSRQLPSAFKWSLIERNTVLMVTKSFPPALAYKVVGRRLKRLLVDAARPRNKAGRSTVWALAVRLPGAVVARVRLRGLVQSHPLDTELFGLVDGSSEHLEWTPSGTFRPKPARSTLAAMYNRRGQPEDRKVAELVGRLPADQLVTSLGPTLQADGPEVLKLLVEVADHESAMAASLARIHSPRPSHDPAQDLLD